jgi:hypothetical protein
MTGRRKVWKHFRPVVWFVAFVVYGAFVGMVACAALSPYIFPMALDGGGKAWNIAAPRAAAIIFAAAVAVVSGIIAARHTVRDCDARWGDNEASNDSADHTGDGTIAPDGTPRLAKSGRRKSRPTSYLPSFVAGAAIGFLPVCPVSCILGHGLGDSYYGGPWEDISMIFTMTVFPLVGGWLAVGVARRRDERHESADSDDQDQDGV